MPSIRAVSPSLGGTLVVCLGLAHPAQAQSTATLPPFVMERLEVTAGEGPLVVGGAKLLDAGALRTSLVGHYEHNPLTLQGDGERLSLIRERTTGVLALAWGARSWLELDAHPPLLTQQEGAELSTRRIAAPARGGLGAPRLGTRLGLMSREQGAAVDLALDLGVLLPSGTGQALARSEGANVSGRVLVGGRLGDVLASLAARRKSKPS
ncbi:hypothetical protein JGU66_07635 [Myxococcaceae bacterium JPH2]|nr:hypothetical protein [Myxococcaceae bacterium JPH2]